MELVLYVKKIGNFDKQINLRSCEGLIDLDQYFFQRKIQKRFHLSCANYKHIHEYEKFSTLFQLWLTKLSIKIQKIKGQTETWIVHEHALHFTQTDK